MSYSAALFSRARPVATCSSSVCSPPTTAMRRFTPRAKSRCHPRQPCAPAQHWWPARRPGWRSCCADQCSGCSSASSRVTATTSSASASKCATTSITHGSTVQLQLASEPLDFPSRSPHPLRVLVSNGCWETLIEKGLRVANTNCPALDPAPGPGLSLGRAARQKEVVPQIERGFERRFELHTQGIGRSCQSVARPGARSSAPVFAMPSAVTCP